MGMEYVYEERAKVFKALCDPRRLHILELLKSGEKCTCVLTEKMDMPQSSLSYHMKILCESGIVVGREDGKWTHYKICRDGSRHAMELLGEILEVNDEPSDCNICAK